MTKQDTLRERVARAILASDMNPAGDWQDYAHNADAAIAIVLEEAAKTMEAHRGRYKRAGHMSDQWACSCGWESVPFFDGAEYAMSEFEKHRLDTIRSLNKQD